VSNPSRDLVLARREALSRSGKRASTSKDRSRAEVVRPAAEPTRVQAKCNCQERKSEAPSATASAARPASLSLSSPSRTSGNGERRPTRKASAQHNPSRSLVLARREALSKRGKSAAMPSSSTAAFVARQGNPDISTRELA